VRTLLRRRGPRSRIHIDCCAAVSKRAARWAWGSRSEPVKAVSVWGQTYLTCIVCVLDPRRAMPNMQ
jgi:hypothetical protein